MIDMISNLDKQITFNYLDDEFKNIVLLLKSNGITTIGADDQLTERNIMKLVNLLKEESPAENNFIDDKTVLRVYGNDLFIKELIELGHSEEDAFKMIFKDFMLTGVKNSDWENYF